MRIRKARSPYSPDFKRQVVDLVRAGRDPSELAAEVKYSASAIRNWVAQADQVENTGERHQPTSTSVPLRDDSPGREATVTRETAIRIITAYGKAWVTKDPSLIQTLFAEDAIYHEQVTSAPIRGRRQIGRYWVNRVVNGQDNIEFKLTNMFLDGSTIIAEWEATFDVRRTMQRRYMKEIAILEIKAGKIQTLREYWSSKIVPKKVSKDRTHMDGRVTGDKASSLKTHRRSTRVRPK